MQVLGFIKVDILCIIWMLLYLPSKPVDSVQLGFGYNPKEFNALHALYNATNGQHWKWSTDIYDGEKWDFSDPLRNNPCSHYWQGAHCAAASYGCDTNPLHCYIFAIQLNGFNLTGTIPSEALNVFPMLSDLSLGDNHLYGPLPSLKEATLLNYVNLSHNQLTGTIPDDLVPSPMNLPPNTSSNLELLYLSGNQLKGSIPDYFYQLPNLKFLNVFNNHLSHTISEMIGLLNNSLIYFNVGKNQLQGSLPNALNYMQKLEYLYVYQNQLRGSLSAISSLTTLKELWISNNEFSGTIPAGNSVVDKDGGSRGNGLCANENITMIAIHHNRLTGTLPPCLSTLSHLQILQVQQNSLKGDNLQQVFNPQVHKNLQFVDLSDNAFSGSFPGNIFYLPELKSIAAVKNCFEGRLPSSICDGGRYLSVIALDGLRLSPKCLNYLWDPFGLSVGYYSTLMEGTIPDCIWSLPNISVVHLSGNGFEGTLPNVIPEHVLNIGSHDERNLQSETGYGAGKCTLRDLSLSHNKLFGTIPKAIQSIPFTNLDLSFNKLFGNVAHITNLPLSNVSSGIGATINLEENRLSGSVPSQWNDAYDVNVLNGNLFACMGADDLPIHDPHYDTYICGSSEYKNALESFGYVLAIIAIVILFLIMLVNCIRPQNLLSQAKTNDLEIVTNKIQHKRTRHSDAFVSKSIQALRYTAEFCSHIYDFDSYLYHRRKEQEKTRSTEDDFGDGIRASEMSFGSGGERVSEFSRPSEGNISGLTDVRDSSSQSLVSQLLYDEAEKERMIRYRNTFQFLSALSLIRSVAITIALYAVCVCLPVYLLFYNAKSSDGDDTRYSSHSQRYGWITTTAFITGTLPASVLLFLWTMLVVLLMIKFVVHFNLHTLESTRLIKIFNYIWSNRSNNSNGTTSDSVNPTDSTIRSRAFSSFSYKWPSIAGFNQPASSNKSEKVEAFYSPLPFNGEEELDREIAVDLSQREETLPPLSIPSQQAANRKSVSFRASSSLFSPQLENNKQTQQQDVEEELSISTKAMEELVANEERKSKFQFWSTYLFIFITNTIVCILMNVAYLYIQNASDISYELKSTMQIFMAGFKIFWNLVAIRIMISWLAYNKHSVKLHVFLLVFNSILAPCIATAFTDEACFANFFQGNDVICTSYHITTCLESYQVQDSNTRMMTTVCTNYANVSYVTEIVPSFIYYYTCGSKLLTAYIPVYLYIYTILLFSGPVLCTLLAAWYRRYFPLFLLKRVDGVLRPGDRGSVLFERLIRAVSIQALLTQHIVVLLTFGLCCPLLALVMMLAISMDCFLWQVIITRYIKYETDSVPFSPNYQVKETILSQVKRLLQSYQNHLEPYLCCFSGSKRSLSRRSSDSGSKSGSGSISIGGEENSTISPLLEEEIEIDQLKGLQPLDKVIHTGRGSIFMQERQSQLVDFQTKSKQEIIASQQKEDSRLFELHTLIGDAWMCIRNAMWLVFYCSMLFYAFVLFDMVGDKGGWQRAFYLVIVVLLLILLIRVLLMDFTIYCHNWWNNRQQNSKDDDSSEGMFDQRFSSFYHHTRKQQKKFLRKLEREENAERKSMRDSGLSETDEISLRPSTTFSAKEGESYNIKPHRGISEGSGDNDAMCCESSS